METVSTSWAQGCAPVLPGPLGERESRVRVCAGALATPRHRDVRGDTVGSGLGESGLPEVLGKPPEPRLPGGQGVGTQSFVCCALVHRENDILSVLSPDLICSGRHLSPAKAPPQTAPPRAADPSPGCPLPSLWLPCPPVSARAEKGLQAPGTSHVLTREGLPFPHRKAAGGGSRRTCVGQGSLPEGNRSPSSHPSRTRSSPLGSPLPCIPSQQTF